MPDESELHRDTMHPYEGHPYEGKRRLPERVPGDPDPPWLDWDNRTLDLREAVEGSFDRGGLEVLEVLHMLRCQHPWRWRLTGGRHYLEMVKHAILESQGDRGYGQSAS